MMALWMVLVKDCAPKRRGVRDFLRLLELLGTNGFYVWKAGEVSGVECKDALHSVDVHGGGKTGVMDLGSGDTMGDQEPTPFLVNLRGIRKEAKLRFNFLGPNISLFNR
jgi:hypothetical protein